MGCLGVFVRCDARRLMWAVEMGTDTRPAPPPSRPSDGGLVSKAANELARISGMSGSCPPNKASAHAATKELGIDCLSFIFGGFVCLDWLERALCSKRA